MSWQNGDELAEELWKATEIYVCPDYRRVIRKEWVKIFKKYGADHLESGSGELSEQANQLRLKKYCKIYPPKKGDIIFDGYNEWKFNGFIWKLIED